MIISENRDLMVEGNCSENLVDWFGMQFVRKSLKNWIISIISFFKLD